MRCRSSTAIFLFFALTSVAVAEKQKSPDSVEMLWSDFDPRQDKLETTVVREWDQDGIQYRYLTFHIGRFKGKPARMAAFFGFPKGAAGSLWALDGRESHGLCRRDR